MIDKVEASEQRLAQRSAKHDEKVARDRAELEERERKVRSRELAVHDRESRLAADQQLVEKARADMRARGQEHFFNGMVREPEHFGR